MDHRRVYEALIRKAVEREGLNGYVEKHHIRPKAIYPELKDDPANIVCLTAREHFRLPMWERWFRMRGGSASALP